MVTGGVEVNRTQQHSTPTGHGSHVDQPALPLPQQGQKRLGDSDQPEEVHVEHALHLGHVVELKCSILFFFGLSLVVPRV